MRAKLLSLMALVSILSLSPGANASTYDVSFSVSTVSVTGTIVTDCDSCVLISSDFLSWSFTLNATTTLAGGPPDIAITGTSTLLASSGTIVFDPTISGTDMFGSSSNDLEFEAGKLTLIDSVIGGFLRPVQPQPL
jgi:hypothetical protein